jgi:hypothetical protein
MIVLLNLTRNISPDHFPGYYMRWQRADLESLLVKLQAQVSIAEDALAKMVERDAVLSAFVKDAELASACMTAVAIDPRVFSLVTAPKLSFSKLRTIIDEVVPGVFAFPLLNAPFARRLIEEVTRFTNFRSTLPPLSRECVLQVPGSSNVTLDALGMACSGCAACASTLHLASHNRTELHFTLQAYKRFKTGCLQL